MRIIDLTLPIEDHFRWKVERRLQSDLAAGDQYQTTWLGLSVHAFTHMDSPRHILADGPTLDDLPLERVVGDCAVIDLCDIEPNAEITRDRIAAAAAHLRADDIALLRACWDRVRSPRTPEFWTEAPYMTRAAATWLLDRGVRAVAYDFPQDYPIRLMLKGERRPFEEHVTHDILLRNGVTMIEYLCNTAALAGARTFLCALPMKVAHSDGAPARVIAIEEL